MINQKNVWSTTAHPMCFAENDPLKYKLQGKCWQLPQLAQFQCFNTKNPGAFFPVRLHDISSDVAVSCCSGTMGTLCSHDRMDHAVIYQTSALYQHKRKVKQWWQQQPHYSKYCRNGVFWNTLSSICPMVGHVVNMSECKKQLPNFTLSTEIV